MSNLEISRAERLDQYVVSILPLLSRSFATKLINDGKATINGKVVTKGGTKLRDGDVVEVDYSPEKFVIPEIELPVLYEDDDCVVIIKPIGLLTHSKGAFNPEASVATWLHHRLGPDLRKIDEDEYRPNARAGIVHRLDRATSGVMICAKTPAALKWLQKQFSQRKTQKTYAAIVSGQLDEDHAIIDMPIERNPKKPQTFRVGVNGKHAITEYTVLAATNEVSEVELKPQTGRTHQLRVHLSQLGNPIVGDVLYGGKSAERMYLHAEKLELTLPNRNREVFTAPIPAEFKAYMKQHG